LKREFSNSTSFNSTITACQYNKATFFSLLRELRDIIYEYALTFDEIASFTTHQRVCCCTLQRHTTALKEDKRKRRIRTSTVVHHEKTFAKCNMKLVCQQMHEEVHGVAHQFGKVQFHSEKHEEISALQACHEYLNTVPKRVRTGLRRIVMIERPTSSYINMLPKMAMALTDARYRAICAFCRDRATAQVILRLDRTPYHPTTLHVALRMALRDQTLDAFPEKHSSTISRTLDYERKDMEAVLWTDANRSDLLSNYRVTLTSAAWDKDTRPQERGLAERLFEEGY
jgi:hypothetical protein